ncbi:hypothetical protein X747_29100 [Mesorhizobium sp. LNJC384A00]|jgi:hypothetical protein|uniref:hypothetical protein n=1 Tax=unclassified Mesorhizobium TaxID=325217 RepID=UPI0003CE0139|nr:MULTISPECIES: hypothetical protein [unclassified Mesorhizobium]ESX20338.1 hypothetical protein X766_08950 [Mesorhizobium sp. LSJC255A00]ESX78441.1 hypothetical protein X757_08165 [Mesorhizobium sp. LSHC414A00]ESY34688.1 hypothetical protein X747_29100 [Mesorhizobium sp. LNJC384A00]
MSEMSVFIAESVSPVDFYIGRTDGRAAFEVVRLHQVRCEYRVVLDRLRLKKAVREALKGDFGVFHLSCHGADDGVRLSDGTDLSWTELAEILKPLASVDRLLVMACCSGGYAGLATELRKAGAVFGYVFGSTAEAGVTFTHSCLAWSALYNGLIEGKFTRKGVQKTIDRINGIAIGDFVYRRWGGAKYLHYPVVSQALPPKPISSARPATASLRLR